MPNPPVPTQLKVMRGTVRADRSRNEPNPAPAIRMRPPPYLPSKGVPWQTWFRLFPILTKMRVMTEADRDALALGCIALDEYLSLREDPGAAWQRVDAAWKRYWRMLEGFGMTPAARVKVKTVEAVAKDPLAEWESKAR